MSQSMEALVEQVFELNRLFDPGVEQKLGSPASNESIEAFETWAGVALPPSYRDFLRLHDGWFEFSGSQTLPSLGELMEGEYADRVEWSREEVADWIPGFLDGCVVIGLSLYATGWTYLDTREVDGRGEMKVVRWDFDSEFVHDDFYDLLASKARVLTNLVQRRRD